MSESRALSGAGLAEAAGAAPAARRSRRGLRRLGTTVVVVGVALVAYGLLVLLWRDPFTALYTSWQQRQLRAEFAQVEKTYALRRELGPAAASHGAPVSFTAAARRYEQGLALGSPFARLEIPRLHLDVISVHGTRWAQDLSRGPGHYPQSSVPGLGKTTAIAGHRTTFGAPFRHIDALRRGDRITLVMPYGTFVYRVVSHMVVAANDWSILDARGYDALVLSACHPLYSASHRWIVVARLARATAPGDRSGQPVSAGAAARPAAAPSG